MIFSISIYFGWGSPTCLVLVTGVHESEAISLKRRKYFSKWERESAIKLNERENYMNNILGSVWASNLFRLLYSSHVQMFLEGKWENSLFFHHIFTIFCFFFLAIILSLSLFKGWKHNNDQCNGFESFPFSRFSTPRSVNEWKFYPICIVNENIVTVFFWKFLHKWKIQLENKFPFGFSSE